MDKKRFSQIAATYPTSDPRESNNMRVLSLEVVSLRSKITALEARIAALEYTIAPLADPSVAVVVTTP